ncbi:hypothetical protein GB931_20525 [Modestobacter sp. I12A-02628]|uniref:Uncharacterized protein n=1 Tax=Goekera deserti TaxID=2497753 RepID=A0A7K3W8L9_9ACTN|nr:DUF6350 family protein [Goekera deserti]MPR00258.1 hypothetical protein [Goekera deserti]NDI49432.1 hypothetical protein [Goekera deserti]NEL52694.1 hypothetical protein [Goekera deserti]
MTSLLARLPRPGRRDDAPLPVVAVGGLAAAAAVAVTATALLGLWLGLVVVNTLDPDGGLSSGGSARVAAQLWLLAGGAGLTLPSGPLVVAPLLLTTGLVWALSRAGRWVVRHADVTGPVGPAVLLGALVSTHTGLMTLLALAADAPGARVGLLRVVAGALVLSLAAAGLGVARETGLLDGALDAARWPARALARAVVAGTCALCALCALVLAVALASDADGFAALLRSLGGAGAGVLGLLALCVLLVPNAALAVAGLAAGPGFVVGEATLVSVGGVTLGTVPALPLFAALPDTQAVPFIAFVSQAVPAIAGLVAGVTLGRHMRAEDGGSLLAGLWGVAAGLGVGVAVGVLVWVAGAQLGDGGLTEVGAPAFATGLATGAQAGIAAALAGLVTRWRSPG